MSIVDWAGGLSWASGKPSSGEILRGVIGPSAEGSATAHGHGLTVDVQVADERGLVSGLLQKLGIEDRSGGHHPVVVNDAMSAGVLAGQDRSPARPHTADLWPLPWVLNTGPP